LVIDSCVEKYWLCLKTQDEKNKDTVHINCVNVNAGDSSDLTSLISQEEHERIATKLHNPTNGLRGYVELQEWISQEFNKTIKYNTLLKYCGRNFGFKSKVSRKSHI